MAASDAVLEVLRSVEESGLELYTAVFAEDRSAVEKAGVLRPHRISGSKNYIGLRENPEDAMQRMKQVYKGIPNVENQLVLLRVTFSNAGLGHFAKKCAGAEHAFASVLHKVVYPDYEVDWKAWHFLEDLPLHLRSPNGIVLISTEWQDPGFMNVEAM